MTAEAVEVLTGRALDIAVAALMGWTGIEAEAYVNYGTGRDACGTTPDGKGGFYNSGRASIPHYSTDIKAAWAVRAEMKRRGWSFGYYDDTRIVDNAEFWMPANPDTHTDSSGAHAQGGGVGDGATAICRAALLAAEKSTPAGGVVE